jgi:hypothetical protein
VQYIFDAICPSGREGIYIISQLRSSYIAFAVRQIYRVLHRKTYRSVGIFVIRGTKVE